MRGQIYTINQKKFFVLGGAQSMDRMYRIEGKSWWKSEEVNAAEIEEAFANLDANNWKVDYVITHCAPYGAGLYRKNCETERVLGVIEADLKYKDWYCGHYHLDRDYGNLHLLYDTIIELQI